MGIYGTLNVVMVEKPSQHTEKLPYGDVVIHLGIQINYLKDNSFV